MIVLHLAQLDEINGAVITLQAWVKGMLTRARIYEWYVRDGAAITLQARVKGMLTRARHYKSDAAVSHSSGLGTHLVGVGTHLASMSPFRRVQ